MRPAPAPPSSRTLLEQVQRLLERTYRMESGLEELGRFVIGDQGYRELYGRPAGPSELPSSVASTTEGAKTLVRQLGDSVRACIYYPDALIERLERFPPQRGLHEANVDAFACLVEELDHLLLLADRSRQRRTVSLFELELHANVSKYLVLSRFLAGRRSRLTADRRWWLRHHLFGKLRFCDSDPAVRSRYSDAVRWAVQLLDALARLPVAVRLKQLRAFHAGGAQDKLALIRELAT